MVRWRPRKGITVEADPRHVEILIEGVEVQSLKALKIAVEKVAATWRTAESVSRHRNHLAADRPDVMFAVTEGVGEQDGLPLSVRECCREGSASCPAPQGQAARCRMLPYLDDQDESKDTQILTGLAAGRLGARPVAGASFTDRTTSRAGRARSQPKLCLLQGLGSTESSERRPRRLGLCRCSKTLERRCLGGRGNGNIRHGDTDMLWVPGEEREQGAGVQQVSWLAEPRQSFHEVLVRRKIMDAHVVRFGMCTPHG